MTRAYRNMTPEARIKAIVDDFVVIEAEYRKTEREFDALRKKIINYARRHKLKDATLFGTTDSVTVSKDVQNRLNNAALREVLTPKALERCYRKISFYRVLPNKATKPKLRKPAMRAPHKPVTVQSGTEKVSL